MAVEPLFSTNRVPPGGVVAEGRMQWAVKTQSLPLINAEDTDRKRQKRTADTVRRGERLDIGNGQSSETHANLGLIWDGMA